MIFIKDFKLPKIGLRNLKTALAVFTCMIIFQLINRENPFFACIAAVFCMKDTVSSSVIMGKNRIIGTIIGGFLGIIVIYISDLFPLLYKMTPFVTGIGIILVIYTCTIIKRPASVVISCIVFIGIMINYSSQVDSYYYAISRSFDTVIGIIISILINKYLNPPIEKSLNIK